MVLGVYNILLRKLHTYGIRGLVDGWFKSYLSDRHQYVDIENTLPIGIPQGSILGPLLYLIYAVV